MSWDDLEKKYGGTVSPRAPSWEDLDERVAAQIVERPQPQAAPPKESAAFLRGRDAPGALRGLANVMQGPTLGFGDEIYGAARAALSGFRPGAYTEARDMARGAAAQAGEDNPIFSTATQVLAGLPLMALQPGAPAASMMGRAGQAGLLGAGFGTASGAGKSEAETAGGVALDAGVGGLLGGAMSAAAVPLQAGVMSATGNVVSRYSGGVSKAHAAEKVAEALQRDARGTLNQTSPDAAIAQARAQLRKLGPEARLVDAGGTNTRGLLDINATLPGQTKELTERAIRQRQAGRGDRLIGAAAESLQTGGRRAIPQIEEWAADRRLVAGPLYERVHKMAIPADERIAGIVSAADELGASAVARRIATAERTPFTLEAAAPQHSMRDLDRLKQGLDNLIEGQTDKVTNKVTTEGRSLIGLKNDLVAALDDATGGLYKEARNAYAGPSALMEAARRGRDIFKGSSDALEASVKGLQGSEREAFQLGAFEALRAKLGKESGQTEILKLWKEPATAERLKAVFGDKRAFDSMYAAVLKEGRLKAIESTGRGSQTAARQFAAGDLDLSAVQDMGAAMGSAAAGNPVGLLAAGGRLVNSFKTPEPVRDAMGSLLLRQGDDAQMGLLELSNAMRSVQQRRANQIGAAGLLGGGALGPAAASFLPVR